VVDSVEHCSARVPRAARARRAGRWGTIG
jgi:hypothetical protein